MKDGEEVQDSQRSRCANCDIEFSWPATIRGGKIYCCSGCAAGGPCCCDYSQYNAVNVSGVILYGPGDQRPQQCKDTKNSGKEVYVVANIRPIGDRVVVEPAAREETTKSGIVIPDTAKEKPQEGVVIAVGNGRLLESGDRSPLDVHEGDRVLFAKYGGTEFKLDGKEYLVLKESDILAVIA
jgi:chaperonin GroES